MRTTIELDDELVADARRALAGKSLKAMIEDSLREAIRARQREALLRWLEPDAPSLLADDYDLAEIRRLDLERVHRLEGLRDGPE